MSATTTAKRRRSETRTALGDTAAITRRNLTRLARTPDSIIFGIAQSVMFVLLFRFLVKLRDVRADFAAAKRKQ